MIVDGFCKQVFRELPMEFAVEAKKLLEVSPGRRGRLTPTAAGAAIAAIRDLAMRPHSSRCPTCRITITNHGTDTC